MGALDGIKIIELSSDGTAFAGKLLADMGADVIVVEPPGGSAQRRYGPFLDDVVGPERSLHWWHYNTSKQGITLNLNTSDGRELFKKLADTADVILETFNAGYLPSLGLGYEDLVKTNPRLKS